MTLKMTLDEALVHLERMSKENGCSDGACETYALMHRMLEAIIRVQRLGGTIVDVRGLTGLELGG